MAQAGRKGRITISTNMAGRGTDILLGGNPEFLAKREVGPEPSPLEIEGRLVQDHRLTLWFEGDQLKRAVTDTAEPKSAGAAPATQGKQSGAAPATQGKQSAVNTP